MTNRKGAIELATSTIVTIIISLVILAFGIVFLYNLINGSENIKSQLDEQTNAEIEHLLVDQGKPVVLPLHTVDLYGGDSHVFGLGILNTHELANFHIIVDPIKYVDKLGQQKDEILSQVKGWILYNTDTFSLEQGEHKKEGIMINLPNDAPKGQYIFNVQVIVSNSIYGNPQKFYVNVK